MSFLSYFSRRYDPDEELMKRDFPDRSPGTEYNMETLPDQRDLTRSADTFKMAKTYYSMTKDINKDVLDKGVKLSENSCEIDATGLWIYACYALSLVLIVLGFYVQYSGLIAYHLTNIIYESLVIAKNNYAKTVYYNQKASDKWITKALQYLQFDMFR